MHNFKEKMVLFIAGFRGLSPSLADWKAERHSRKKLLPPPPREQETEQILFYFVYFSLAHHSPKSVQERTLKAREKLSEKVIAGLCMFPLSARGQCSAGQGFETVPEVGRRASWWRRLRDTVDQS